jgi:hypothetical protein
MANNAPEIAELRAQLHQLRMQSAPSNCLAMAHTHRFDGKAGHQSFAAFLRCFERWFPTSGHQVADQGQNNANKRIQLVSQLDGEAADVFDAMIAPANNDFAQICAQLQDKYPDGPSSRIASAELVAKCMVVGEDIETFANEIKRLTTAAYVGTPAEHLNPIILETFLSRITVTYYRICWREDQAPVSLAAAVARCKAFDETEQVCQLKETLQTALATGEQAMERIQPPPPSRVCPPGKCRAPQQTRQARRQQVCSVAVVCQLCHQQGHDALVCPYTQWSPPPPGEQLSQCALEDADQIDHLICSSCHELGHISVRCPNGQTRLRKTRRWSQR